MGTQKMFDTPIVAVKTLAQHGGIPSPVVSCAGQQMWTDFCVERYRLNDVVPPTGTAYSRHIIVTALGGSCLQDVSATTGRRTFRWLTGETIIYPAQYPHVGHDAENFDLLFLSLQPEFIERAAGDFVIGGIEFVPQHKLDDAFVRDISRYLLAEAEADCPTGRLYGESLATALAVHLLRNYSVNQPPIRKYNGGLQKYKLHRALEYFDAHLTDDISLDALAKEIGMSSYYFARLFKQSTGQTPHQYLINLRIKLAKHLLADPRLTIADIALQVGCANQSHFSTMFRNWVGLTPLQYRQLL